MRAVRMKRVMEIVTKKSPDGSWLCMVIDGNEPLEEAGVYASLQRSLLLCVGTRAVFQVMDCLARLWSVASLPYT